MKKRILSLLCVFCLMLTMLPTSAFAAGYDAPTLSIDASYLAETNQVKMSVKIGAYTDLGALDFHVKYDKEKLKVNGTPTKGGLLTANSTVSDNNSWNPATIGVSWVDENGSTTTTTTEILTVIFDVIEGKTGAVDFSFDEAKYNFCDKSGDNSTDAPGAGSVGAATVTIPKASIASVTASVDAPVKGQTLDTTVDVGGATAYTGTVEWYKGNAATGSTVSGKAEANQIYTAKITLTANSGESFAKGVTTPTGYTKVSANATTIVLTKTFPATAEKTLTGITIKTCPHTTYTAGEQFNKAGMVITAAYDDGSTKDVQPTYFQFTPVDPLTVNNKEVTISYTEGNVTKTAKQKITVNPKALTANMVQPIASQPYTGSAIEPTVTVKDGRKTLTAGTDYTVTYKDNTNVGTATATVTGKGNYTGSVEAKFNITAKALTASMVHDIAAQTYTGSPIVPKLTVKDGETALSKDTDYTVKYRNNLNAGTATVTLTGKGNYAGSVEIKFNITAKALTASMVRDIAAQTYTGSPIVPELTVKDGETALSKDTDYTVKYRNNLNAGTATVTLTGKGNYAGSVEIKFNITAKALTASMVRDIAAQTYTGSPIVPELTVKDGETALSKDTDYTVKYQNNLNAGTATVTLTGKGNYSDSVSKTFTIKQKDVTAQRDATDIQVVVDKGTFDAPTFGDVTGTLTYSYDGATSYDAIVKKLETLQLGATGDIGYTYTANGNYTGTITGKLHFTVVNLPAATITTAPAAKTGLTFNGTEQVLVNAGSGIIGGTLQYKLDGGSYNAELPKATNAGNYTVYYKVKGNNTTHSDSSEQSFTVTIAPKTVTAAVSVEPTSYTYTGEAIVPTTVTVKDGTTVIPASEYTVTYGNNTNAGKATVTVKDQDGGNYVVSGTATFTITKAELSGVTVSLGGWTYGDTAKTPTVSGNLGGGNVTYQYKADNASTYTSTVPTNAGTYTVKATVAESANYKAATATGSFTIAPKTVTNAAVTLSQTSYAYTGRAFQPSVTVKDGTTVIPASEYTVAYTDNINVGTATVTVSDRAGGNYVVSGTATFTITKAALSGVSVSLIGWTYGDTAKTPTVSGNLGNANVTYQYKAADAADETYTNVVPTNAGTYTVKATVAESANYAAATATRNFTIVPKAISKATVENIGEQEFTGRTITPTVTVKDGTVVLTDADYSVAYANNIDAGTANVTITGKGNYTGSTSVKFTIAQAAAPVVVDDSGATVTAPDTTKENVAGKLDETGKTKYNKDSKGEVTTDEEIILGNVKKAMGVTGTNSTMITAQVTTSGSATKAMTVLPYAQGADSRKNFTVKKLNADGTIETIDSRNVVKMAAGLKLELEDGAIYAISWTTPSSSGSGSSYTSGQSFTTDLPADSINRVTVNGKKLDSKYYTVSSNGSGSIVTLTDAYLATLKAGKYTVKIENKTHVSTGTFTIKADGTLSSPRTADAGIALYAMLAVSSLMGTAVVSKKRRKA